MWKFKGGEGRWKEYVNEDTGESSIKEHKPKLVWKSCAKDQCYFEWLDIPKREVKCRKCGKIRSIVIGMQELKDGQIKHLSR